MKRLLMVMMLGIAGMASAVTVQWNADKILLAEGGSKVSVLIVAGDKASAIKLAEGWTLSFSGYANIGDLKDRETGNGASNLQATVFSNNGGTSWGGRTGVTSGSEATGEVVFSTSQWKEAGSPEKLTIIFMDENGFNGNATLMAGFEVNAGDLMPEGADSVTIHVGDLDLRGDTVPEPTVMALLVLGITGMALRRRVA